MVSDYPLYDPLNQHDACGVGFVADRTATASHRIVKLGVTCLHNLDHRGARSADGTGDGAGMMTAIPHRLVERELAANGIAIPPRDRVGLVMAFLPTYGVDDAKGTRLIHDALASLAEGEESAVSRLVKAVDKWLQEGDVRRLSCVALSGDIRVLVSRHTFSNSAVSRLLQLADNLRDLLLNRSTLIGIHQDSLYAFHRQM